MEKHEESSKARNPLIPILVCITAAALCITAWTLFSRDPDPPPLTPDRAPQEEQRVETIPGDSGEKIDNPEGGGSVSLTYSRDVTVDLKGKCATLFFANPGKSNQDIVLQIVIRNTVIVQSGLLTPGNQVTTLALLDGAAGKLSNGVYEGNFNVLYYDPITGEKAIVNTEIPITITVNP